VSLHNKYQPFNVVNGSKCYFSVRTVPVHRYTPGKMHSYLKLKDTVHTVMTMLQRIEMY